MVKLYAEQLFVAIGVRGMSSLLYTIIDLLMVKRDFKEVSRCIS